MTLKLTSLGRSVAQDQATAVKVVIVTMDTHLASSIHRAKHTLSREFPGLSLSLHAASEYTGNEVLIERCRADIASADIVV